LLQRDGNHLWGLEPRRGFGGSALAALTSMGYRHGRWILSSWFFRDFFPRFRETYIPQVRVTTKMPNDTILTVRVGGIASSRLGRNEMGALCFLPAGIHLVSVLTLVLSLAQREYMGGTVQWLGVSWLSFPIVI